VPRKKHGTLNPKKKKKLSTSRFRAHNKEEERTPLLHREKKTKILLLKNSFHLGKTKRDGRNKERVPVIYPNSPEEHL